MQENCHFCESYFLVPFTFQIGGIGTKRSILVCKSHFDELYYSVYTSYSKYKHFPNGQKEYVAIKHLELKLGVKNTIQFNE